jgi:thiol-disulfide isomerase/thioredoxin
MRRVVFALSLAVAALPVRLGAQELGIAVGSKAPGAAVETLDGKAADLGELIGKTPIIVQFWATWCPNCKQLEPQVEAARKKYGERVKFVGVAVSVNQSPARVKEYVEKHGLDFTIFFDKKGFAADAYDAPATSYMVGIDKAGTIVYTGLGGNQNVDAVVRKTLGEK